MELISSLPLVPILQSKIYPTQGHAEFGGMGKNPVSEKRCKTVDLMRKSLCPPLIAALVTLSPILQPPVTFAQGVVDIQRGAKLFSQSCIGCHNGGGNVIQPGATLFLKDLQRNEVDKEEEIYKITYYGKERMPGFGVNCTPRGQCTFGGRLQDDEIKILAEFVKLQADQGWSDLGNVTD